MVFTKFTKFRSVTPNRGFTLLEVMVVVSLSSVVLLVASRIVSRTTSTFKKGTDLLNVQLTLDSIVERLRSDVRSMTQKLDCKPDSFQCMILYKGREQKIVYTYDRNTKTLKRENVTEGKVTNFQAKGQVENLVFEWQQKKLADGTPDPNDTGYLSMVIQIESDEMSSLGRESKLPLICVFSPKCTKPFLPQYLRKD